MCTLALYRDCLPGLPLVVAANRDEYRDRAAAPPGLLSSRPRVVGGQDLVAGGTWLAVAEHGLVSGLLNRRTATPRDAPRSRGELPLRMLRARSAADAEAGLAELDPAAYQPFNLLVADRERAWVAQNRDGRLALTRLDRGLHLLSNLDANDPRCPRIAHSHRAFAEAGQTLRATRDTRAFRAALGRTLRDHTTALDPREHDPLGALCVHMGGYGTRCSSLLFLDDAGRWQHWFADGAPCTAPYEPSAAP